jgi:hypothetical protein
MTDSLDKHRDRPAVSHPGRRKRGEVGPPCPADEAFSQATSVLAAARRMSLPDARNALREISARTGIKERHVAHLLCEWARTGTLCTDLRTELHRYPPAKQP